ncbi:extracellular solute-binding protein [Bacillus sp. sid0103]|uniref:ABC transporter substrate-binding protein n=1 Tax=Bacillus sp. sid0103 TaxID=2856337 RepID=UPI001C496331|nr:extracellular solute-binding protein [Bacillus sp. sid0103]MBV7504376.1 extracellular solute-binding protein [Bacillus sp. sid0103]
MKKFNRKVSVLLTTVLLGATVLSACSSKETSKSNSKESNLVEYYMDKSNWATNFDKVGKLTAEKYGTGIKAVPFSDTTSFQTTIKQSLQGNEPPTLFSWWSGFRMKEIVEAGAAADLTAEWKDYYEKEGLNPELAKAYTIDGKVYGAPLHVSYWNVFYNKKVFDKYGLKEPKTWDEFMNVLDTLKKNGVTPFAQPFKSRWQTFIWFEELLAHSDPALYDKLMVGEASYTDPGVVKVMELWKSLIDKGYFSKPGDIDGNLLSDIAKGDVGMVLMGQWWQSSLLKTGLQPGSDFGAFIVPAINDGVGNVAIYETSPIVVAEKSKNKEKAKEAVRNFFKKEPQQLWTESQGFAPLLPEVKSNNVITDKISEDIGANHYQLLQRYWEATPPEISEFAVDQFAKFILDTSTYKEVLETIEGQAQKVWVENK